MKRRLDQELVQRGLAPTRSQAESYIKLGDIRVNGEIELKPGTMVTSQTSIEQAARQQYVSRAALKLASVAEILQLQFTGKIVLDVGSSTGGFTDYALKHGAKRVIAVEVGTDQMHPTLLGNSHIELHEKTDIRDFKTSSVIDICVADVSFISLRQILPSIADLCNKNTDIVVMVKPQFEASESNVKHKGVIKNDTMRRQILKDFEQWASGRFKVIRKADSEVAGAKGNRERFYLLQTVNRLS